MPPFLHTAEDAVAIFLRAAELNIQTQCREGNMLTLDKQNAKDVLLTGDLHGHVENYYAILKLADMEKYPSRHLVFQEICHGGPQLPDWGGCCSHRMLTEVANMKVRYPQRVHHIMSNHELAELTRYPIQKNRQFLNSAFAAGMRHDYGVHAEDVRIAMLYYLETCPLAVRISGNVFFSHSIPNLHLDPLHPFDDSIFYRSLDPGSDFIQGGSVYRLVWGREYSQSNADEFAKMVGAEILVCGHEPCAEGCKFPNSRQVIIDCSADVACCMLIPTSMTLTQWNFRTFVVPLENQSKAD